MQVRGAYDLIVIGDQLSGLFLAAGAAQAGQKVLVLEEVSTLSILYEIPSGRLLGDFIVEPAIGLQKGSAIDQFLGSLGLYQELQDLFPLHEPPLQVVAPGMRLDFSYQPEALSANLAQALAMEPEKRTRFARLLSGTEVSKKSFAELVAELGLPVTYEAFAHLQLALFGSLVPENMSYLSYKKVIDYAARGLRFPLGGRSALKERLLNRVLVYGGNIKRSTRVEEIVFERGRLSGVLLSSYEGFVRSRRVAGAMGARRFFELIPKDLRPKKLQEAIRRERPIFWRLNFTILLPERAIPEGMGSHLAAIVPNEGLQEENFLQLQLFSKDAYGGIPEGHRALVVRTLVPFTEESISLRYISRVLRRSLAQLNQVFPFLRESPFLLSPDPDKLEQDPVFQKFYRFTSLEHIPSSFLVYESGFSEKLDQRDYLDWSHFGLPGLALCSRDIHPLLGLTGEMLTAMELLAKWKEDR